MVPCTKDKATQERTPAWMMTSAQKGSADRTTNYKLWKHQEVINPYYQHLPHLPSPSSLIIRTKRPRSKEGPGERSNWLPAAAQGQSVTGLSGGGT